MYTPAALPIFCMALAQSSKPIRTHHRDQIRYTICQTKTYWLLNMNLFGHLHGMVPWSIMSPGVVIEPNLTCGRQTFVDYSRLHILTSWNLHTVNLESLIVRTMLSNYCANSSRFLLDVPWTKRCSSSGACQCSTAPMYQGPQKHKGLNLCWDGLFISTV